MAAGIVPRNLPGAMAAGIAPRKHHPLRGWRSNGERLLGAIGKGQREVPTVDGRRWAEQRAVGEVR